MSVLTTIAQNVRKNAPLIVGRPADANAVVTPGVRTVGVPVCSSASLLDFNCRIPTDCRIDPSSRIYNDAIGTTSATLTLGFRAVSGNISTNYAAMISGLNIAAVSTANAGDRILSNANGGKKVWELLGLSSDPGGFVDVVGQIKTAAVTTTGFVSLDLKLQFN